MVETVDLTSALRSVQWQKSLKTPEGGCEIMLHPATHGSTREVKGSWLVAIQPFDVVRVYEYGTLKWQGYVHRRNFSGLIQPDGKPSRSLTLSCLSFGSLFSRTQLGLALGDLDGAATQFISMAQRLRQRVGEAVGDGASYRDLILLLIDAWFELIRQVGAADFETYVRRYVNADAGLYSSASSVVPKTFELYSGSEMEISLWDVGQQLIDSPFFELWFDEGPRAVDIAGSITQFGRESTYLVFRPTPFDGAVENGIARRRFSALQSVQIPLSRLVRYDLGSSLDEVYTAYTVTPAAFDFGELARTFTGEILVDREKLGRYLLRNLPYAMNYVQAGNGNDSRTIKQYRTDAVETLFNWFQRNDAYLAGNISALVPTKSQDDPRIGQRVELEGVEGSMYVEGVSHTWSYSSTLMSSLSVTRGYVYGKDVPMTTLGGLFD